MNWEIVCIIVCMYVLCVFRSVLFAHVYIVNEYEMCMSRRSTVSSLSPSQGLVCCGAVDRVVRFVLFSRMCFEFWVCACSFQPSYIFTYSTCNQTNFVVHFSSSFFSLKWILFVLIGVMLIIFICSNCILPETCADFDLQMAFVFYPTITVEIFAI